MAYRDRTSGANLDKADFRVLEVQLTRVDSVSSPARQVRFVTVDNRPETLAFLEKNLDVCIGNIVKLERLGS